jgi:hypothetical protein
MSAQPKRAPRFAAAKKERAHCEVIMLGKPAERHFHFSCGQKVIFCSRVLWAGVLKGAAGV